MAERVPADVGDRPRGGAKEPNGPVDRPGGRPAGPSAASEQWGEAPGELLRPDRLDEAGESKPDTWAFL